jgi:hypothetical protein
MARQPTVFGHSCENRRLMRAGKSKYLLESLSPQLWLEKYHMIALP